MSDNAPTLRILSPANGELVGEVPVTPVDQVAAVVARVREAQRAWAARSIAERRAVLLDVRESVLDHTDEIVDLLVRQNGKPRQEALMHEVMTQLGIITYFANETERILAPQPIPMSLTKHRASYLHYPPRGVVGIIAPWNFPLALPFGTVVMALMAGNGVVLKPSEFTPLIADYMRKLYVDAGVPDALFAIVHGHGDVGAALCHGGVDMIEFTGSVATGRKVAAACGERLIPCVLELGGKAPAIVLPDAPFDRTIDGLLWGGIANAGQVCASIERVLVPSTMHDKFVDALATKMRGLRVGDATKGAEVDVGPLVNERQREIVDELVQDALQKGARAVVGGKRIDGPGLFYEPTLLVDVTPEMAILNRETFGPVLPVVRYDGEDAAIAEANRSKLGLLAYVFTRDVEHGRRLAERIHAGTVMINDVLATHAMPETPWGGVKNSGLGHTHSDDGLRHMCELRHVNLPATPWLKRELWWYPYRHADVARFKRGLAALYGRGLKRFVRAA